MKEKIRDEAKERRRRLPARVRGRETVRIGRRLLADARFISARLIAFYAATSDEVATAELVKQAMTLGKRVAFPQVEGEHLLFRHINTWEELRPGAFGILAPPVSAPLVSLAAIDLMIVPGVAFDRSGGRLGYGGGFYDRTLEAYAGPSVGLAFSCQMYDQLPVSDWDQVVDDVITGEE